MGYELRSPTETTAPVAGTTAGLYTFGTPAGKLLVSNASGVRAYLRFNSASAATATAGAYDVALESRDTSWLLDAAELGLRDFATVSVWLPSGGTVGSFAVRGQ